MNNRPHVLVTGSRTWRDESAVRRALDEALARWPHMIVMHGACRTGADAIAHTWCLTRAVPVLSWPADWRQHGRAAGPIRNAALVAAGAVVCLAFIRNASRGASGCAALAQAAGIPVQRYTNTVEGER